MKQEGHLRKNHELICGRILWQPFNVVTKYLGLLTKYWERYLFALLLKRLWHVILLSATSKNYYIYILIYILDWRAIFLFFEKSLLYSTRLHLFDQKYSKNSDIVKYYNNWKNPVYLNIF